MEKKRIVSPYYLNVKNVLENKTYFSRCFVFHESQRKTMGYLLVFKLHFMPYFFVFGCGSRREFCPSCQMYQSLHIKSA